MKSFRIDLDEPTVRALAAGRLPGWLSHACDLYLRLERAAVARASCEPGTARPVCSTGRAERPSRSPAPTGSSCQPMESGPVTVDYRHAATAMPDVGAAPHPQGFADEAEYEAAARESVDSYAELDARAFTCSRDGN